MKKDWLQKRELKKGKLVPRHGWHDGHFFVKGTSACQGWKTSIKGYHYFKNRAPKWIDYKVEPFHTLYKKDCAKCTRIWLELYCMFREFKVRERLFP